VYIENLIYLKIETKNIIKIIRYMYKIKKINIHKKFLILKNIENIKIVIDFDNELLIKRNDIKLKDVISIDYKVIE
jgi:hypothetical protein